jgi:hypothetical protein
MKGITRYSRTAGATCCAATAGIMLAVAATTLPAQGYPSGQQPVESHLVILGLGGGVSVPTTNSLKGALKNGINYHGFLGFHPPMGLPMLRLALDYQKFDFKNAAAIDPSGTGNPQANVNAATSSLLGGLANLSFDLLHGPVRPYIMGGVGAFSFKNQGTTTGGAVFSRSNTKFGIDGGAGLAISFGPIAGFAEGRVQNVYTDRGVINTKSIVTIPVTFGLQLGLF